MSRHLLLVHDVDYLADCCKKDNIIELTKYFTKNPRSAKGIPEVWITDYCSQSFSLIHICASSGSIKCIEYLFNQGSDPFQFNNRHWNCLHFAARHGFLNIVELLVSKGIDINLKTDEGYTPLTLASWFSHLDIVQYLFDRGADISIKDNFKCTALHRSCQSCNIEIIDYLLQHGANPDEENDDGPPLLICCNAGDYDSMKVILEANANPNAMFKGKCILHAAVSGYRQDIVELLLEHGAKIDEPDSQGNTVLHMAAYLTQDKMVHFLVENGANINAENRLKETPLHRAAENGCASIFEYLIRAGADVTMRDRVQRTPIDWAKLLDHQNIIETMRRIEEENLMTTARSQREARENEQHQDGLGSFDSSSQFFSSASFEASSQKPSAANLLNYPGNELVIHDAILENVEK